MKNSVLLLVAAFLSLNLNAQEFKTVSDKNAVKTAIEKKHDETTSITADFAEKVYSDMFKEAQSGSGKFYFKKKPSVKKNMILPAQILERQKHKHN